jgi:acyl transferase domain-containing protein
MRGVVYTLIVRTAYILSSYAADADADADAGAARREALTLSRPLEPAAQEINQDQAPLAAAEGQLLAAIVGARISEPGRVATALKELRLESTAHIRRLNLEERYEMMVAMRGAGVALGSRNKLRLLASGSTESAVPLHGQGSRRIQAEDSGGIDQQSEIRRDSATTQARERASEQGSGTEQERNRILGVSGDSASYQC